MDQLFQELHVPLVLEYLDHQDLALGCQLPQLEEYQNLVQGHCLEVELPLLDQTDHPILVNIIRLSCNVRRRNKTGCKFTTCMALDKDCNDQINYIQME